MNNPTVSVVSVRFTAEEKAELERLAAFHGLSLSKCIRRCAVNSAQSPENWRKVSVHKVNGR
jgi:hypothetical protein